LFAEIWFLTVQAGARGRGNERVIYHAQDNVIALKRVFPGIFLGSGVGSWSAVGVLAQVPAPRAATMENEGYG